MHLLPRALHHRQITLQVVPVSFDVDHSCFLPRRDRQSALPVSLHVVVDAWVLSQVEAQQALGVAQVGHQVAQNERVKPRVVQCDALDALVVSDQAAD